MVGESYLNELEAAAKRLRDIESGNAKPASDFKLIGSGRIADGIDDPLADMRRDANALWGEEVGPVQQIVSWTRRRRRLRAAFASGKYHEAELTSEIVYVAQRLCAIAERGDRLIAATTATLDLPLITRDPQIAAAAGVECLWA
jgi:hypothetical protein